MKTVIIFTALSLSIVGTILAKDVSESTTPPFPELSLQTAFADAVMRPEFELESFNCSWTELRCD